MAGNSQMGKTNFKVREFKKERKKQKRTGKKIVIRNFG